MLVQWPRYSPSMSDHNADNQSTGAGAGAPAVDPAIAALIGQFVESAGGIVEEIVRVEGNKVTTASGNQLDLAEVLALIRAQQPPPPAPAPEQNWVPWAIGGGLVLVLLVSMRR